MIQLDVVNSFFSAGSIFFIICNCYSAYRDKRVSGVSIYSVLFFCVYSLFNIIYFFELNQMFSFTISIFVFIFQFIYAGLLFYYRRSLYES